MNTTPLNATEMVQDAPSVAAATPATPVQLADYQLEEKLGAGGYGEVWRAIGPGGLPKAVKILYGERHGEHAEAELKALERMRDLRHPFLLSIERIEVVGGKLIVVTELADGNLTDQFSACRKQGKKGIPRDELLGYLRDSADALDFMFEHHGLQHLDIKPDNILLQGNHAKVGDFGLAKDLNATNVSVINGFTPLYAAPELFEGRPGRATDQYSLAICYQAMLTGKAPFSGRTAAQLTAQHLRSQPDLSELQPIDRPVIARALSKNANSRFDNCRQFVDELVRRKHSRTNTQAAVVIDLNAAPPVFDTELVNTQGTSGPDSAFDQPSTPVESNAIQNKATSIRPSIVVSVGGFGGVVLREFKNQIAERQNGDGSVFPILAIDSSRQSLSELRATPDTVGLSIEESLDTPLRTSKHYRSASEIDLSWLSRRWLFNIPRNCQVDGIRPLGRLALCDHRKAVEARLVTLLQQLNEPQRRDAMSQVCELPMADTGVDVYIIGATSGGTGSGMISDVGLMIRDIVEKHNLNDVAIHGVMVHGTGALRKVVDVQEANTASLMKELQHLCTPGIGTPRGFGNETATRDHVPFDHKYFLHIGDGLNGAAFDSKAKTIANFLTQVTSSAAKADLQLWNDLANQEFTATDHLRILGIGEQDSESLRMASSHSSKLSYALMKHWCTINSSDNESFPTEIQAHLTDSMSLMTELRLTDDTLSRHVMLMLRGDLGKEIEAYATYVNRELIKKLEPETVTHRELLDEVSGFVSTQDSGSDIRTLHDIVRDVQKNLSAATHNCQAAVRGHLSVQLNSPFRLPGAEVVAKFVGNNLVKTRNHCDGLLREIEKAFQTLVTSEHSDHQFAIESQMLPIEQVAAFSQQYCVLLAYQTVYQCFIQYVDAVIQTVDEFSQGCSNVREQMTTQVAEQTESDADIPQEIVEGFDKNLRSTAPNLLMSWCESNGVQFDVLAQAAVRFLVTMTDSQQEFRDSSCRAFPENAWPSLRKLGGQRRVLGLVPAELNQTEWTKRLRDEFGNCVATRTVAGNQLTAICEISGVSLGTMFSKLTHDNPHIADVAQRVHIRSDVEW